MAKTKISEYDATASNNTDVNSVDIAEGCAPSGVNNAIREVMGALKRMDVGTDALTSPDINGGTIDSATINASTVGATTPSTGAFTNLSANSLALGGTALTATAAQLNTLASGSAANDGTITVTAGNALTGGGNFTVNQAGNTGITLNHEDTSNQATVTNSGTTYIQSITLDTYGHITNIASGTVSAGTSANDSTLTITAGGGLTGGGSFTANQSSGSSVTVEHSDTSSQASSNNSGQTFIQDVILDGFGHVTGLATATATSANNATITVQGASGLNGGGTFTTNTASDSTINILHDTSTGSGTYTNSGNTFIQSLVVDPNGHITSVTASAVSSLSAFPPDFTSTVTQNAYEQNGNSTSTGNWGNDGSSSVTGSAVSVPSGAAGCIVQAFIQIGTSSNDSATMSITGTTNAGSIGSLAALSASDGTGTNNLTGTPAYVNTAAGTVVAATILDLNAAITSLTFTWAKTGNGQNSTNMSNSIVKVFFY